MPDVSSDLNSRPWVRAAGCVSLDLFPFKASGDCDLTGPLKCTDEITRGSKHDVVRSCHNLMAASLQQGQGDQSCTLTRLICQNRGSQKAGITVKAPRVPPEAWKQHLKGFKMALTGVQGLHLSHLKFIEGLGEDKPKEPRGHEERKSSLRPPLSFQGLLYCFSSRDQE